MNTDQGKVISQKKLNPTLLDPKTLKVKQKKAIHPNLNAPQNLELVPSLSQEFAAKALDSQKEADSNKESFSIKSSICSHLNECERLQLQRIVARIQQRAGGGFPLMEENDKQIEELVGENKYNLDDRPNFAEGIFFIHFRTWREFFTCQPPQSRYVRICVYDARSLYIFDSHWRVRQQIVKFTESKVFENIVLLAILLSTMLMLLQDYADPENPKNLVLDKFQLIFIVVFTIESALKIIAQGFILHPNAYLRDPWNWIDFLVVVTGIIELTPTSGLSLSALRTLRVLRPLKSISAVPSMKKLIQGMIDSVSALFYAIVFMIFVFVNFAIFGTQQFGGAYYQRCRTTEESVGGIWPYTTFPQSLCGSTGTSYRCPENTVCGVPGQVGLPYGSDPTVEMAYIDYGYTTFDNLIASMITIFQCITLEGWAKIMYNLEDQQTHQWLVRFFFISLITIGSLFLLNLLLAIFADSLERYEEKAIIKENSRKARIALSLKRAKKLRKDEKSEQLAKQIAKAKNVRNRIDLMQGITQIKAERHSTTSLANHEQAEKPEERNSVHIQPVINVELPALPPAEDSLIHTQTEGNRMASQVMSQTELDKHILGDQEQSPSQHQEQLSVSDSSSIVLSNFLADQDEASRHFSKEFYKEFFVPSDNTVPDKKNQNISESQAILKNVLPKRAQRNRLVMVCFKICMSVWFLVTMSLLTVINCIVLAIDRYPISPKEARVWEAINFIVSITFIFEMAIKLIGLGPRQYAKDRANLFDAFIVAISLLEMILGAVQTEGGGGSSLALFRAFRLLRILKLFRQWKTLNQIIDRLSGSLKDICNFAVLMVVFSLVFIILGMQFFSNTVFLNAYNELVDSAEEGQTPRCNFDSVYMSFVTVFALTIGSDWHIIMYDYKRVHNYVATIYFILVVLIANIILIYLFLAILLSNFNEPIVPSQNDTEQKGVQKLRKKLKTGFYKILLMHQRLLRKCFPNVYFIDEAILDRDSDSDEERKKETIDLADKNLDQHNIAVKTMLEKKQSRVLLISEFQNKPKEERFVHQGTISNIAKLDLTKSVKLKAKAYTLKGKSLFFLGETNPLRQAVGRIVNWEHFDDVMVCIILASGLNLALYNPLDDPNSTYSQVIEGVDYLTSVLFIVETLLKIVMYGFLFNGKESYLRTVWNQLDFFIACISFTTFVHPEGFAYLKVLRVVRVLRPLRLIHKQPGLRISIQSLLNATPRIINLLIICAFVLGIFAIMGINFYKGLYYSCQMTNVPIPLQDRVQDYWDCLDYGGEWVNADNNFDNFVNAIKTQFIIMCREGWLAIFFQALNLPSSHYQMPQPNSAPISIIYFMGSICVSSLFILNMFVGIVISTFQQEKEKVSHHSHLTKKESEYIDTCTLCYRTKPVPNRLIGQAIGLKDQTYHIVVSKKFEVFIFVCIVINSVILMLYWYDQDQQTMSRIETINQVLSLVFTIEFLMKIVAFGQKYFLSWWHVLDFSIVIVSWLDFMILAANEGQGLNSSVQAIRTFRVARILKLIKRFKELQRILATFLEAIPALFNVGGLLFLFQFLYGIMGVYLFSTVKLQESLNNHANFQTLGTALVTLFRISTGDGWNFLMEDCSRQRSINFQCYEQTYEQRQLEGIQGCGDPFLGYTYFISFMIFMTFIMLNLFIAIILEGFQKQLNNEEQQIQGDAAEEFAQIWSQFDIEAKGFIPIGDLELFILKVVERELQLKSQPNLQSNFLFNLHKEKFLRLYAIWKLKLRCSDEEQRQVNMIQQKHFLQVKLSKKVHKWIGNLFIPTYNKMQMYYFHDVLIALVKNFFSQKHTFAYMERQARIQNLRETGQELTLMDRIKPDSADYNKLSVMNRQIFNELNSSEFDDVVRSIELKGMRTAKVILKLSQMKSLRLQINSRNADIIDRFADSVIDSSMVNGALTIQRYLKERKRHIWEEMRLKQLQKLNLKNNSQSMISVGLRKQYYSPGKLHRQNLLNKRQMRLLELEEKFEQTIDLRNFVHHRRDSDQHETPFPVQSSDSSSSIDATVLLPTTSLKIEVPEFNSPKLSHHNSSSACRSASVGGLSRRSNQRRLSVGRQRKISAASSAQFKKYNLPQTVPPTTEFVDKPTNQGSKERRWLNRTHASFGNQTRYSLDLEQQQVQEKEILNIAIEMSKVTPDDKKK